MPMKRGLGFTLLELLVTIAVVGILLGVGIPSFKQMLASNRLAIQSNSFVTALSMARSEAMKRGTTVTVCRSTDGSTCTTSAGTGWETGWIVHDVDNAVLLTGGPLSGNNALSGNQHVKNAISFTAQGMLPTHILGGTFTLCDGARAGYQRNIVVAKTGRVNLIRFEGNGAAC